MGKYKNNLICCFVLLTVPFSAFAELPAAGLLLFNEPPGTYVEIVEYSKIIAVINISKIITPKGESQPVYNSGVIARVDYPSRYTDAEIVKMGDLKIQEIKNLIVKYPQYKNKIQVALSKWEDALPASNKIIEDRLKVIQASASGLKSFSMNGVTYKNVTLSSIDGRMVDITHDDGISKLNLKSLNPAQIEELNKTSESVHIDSNWEEKAVEQEKLKAEEAARAEKMANDAAKRSFANPSTIDELTILIKTANSDRFCEPELDVVNGVSYDETISFIQSHWNDPYKKVQIGYGKVTKKIIIKFRYILPGYQDEILVLNPAQLNPEVKIFSETESNGYGSQTRYNTSFNSRSTERGSVLIETLNRQNTLFQYDMWKSVYCTNQFKIPCADTSDAGKMAKAWSHLIYLFGGKNDSF